MFKRRIYNEVIERIGEKRKFLQVLLGARQVGKTTLVRQLQKEYKYPSDYTTADNQQSTDWLEQVWQAARLKLKSSDAKEYLLVIDEIQKIENWSEVVKKYWDEDTHDELNLKVILLGSSSMLIDKGLTESMAGRFETIRIPHWSFTEMRDAFDFTAEQYAYFGGYPGAAELIGNEKRWRDYIVNSLIETTVNKDVLQLSNIYKPKLLKNLFFLGCQYSSQILSFNKILGQLQDAGNTTTLSNYLELLGSAELLTGLEKYSTNQLKSRASSPKFQVFNNALLTAQSAITFEDFKTNPKLRGRIVESAIGAHLLSDKTYKLQYWNESNNEVDFIYNDKNNVVAIEVKSYSLGKHSGLEKFKSKHSINKALLIGSDGISWEKFLEIEPKLIFE